MTRGIVVGLRIDGNKFNFSIDREQISKWLLYWDKIVYAGIGFNGATVTGKQPDDFSYLEKLGVFRTEVVDLNSVKTSQIPAPQNSGIKMFGIEGNQLPYVTSALRKKLCEDLSKNNNDIWTLGQSGGEKLLLPLDGKLTDVIDIQIYEKLPVPSTDTPYEDILEYKSKYSDELNELRFNLDNLREFILNSLDERRALDKALHNLSRSLDDVRKSMTSNKISVINDTISLYTDNPSIGFWGLWEPLTERLTEYPLKLLPRLQ